MLELSAIICKIKINRAGVTTSRKKQRVRCELDSGDIRFLTDEEIKVILRAADELIATGGRSMLAKILKGLNDKKVLEHGLEQCLVYGYYPELTLQEITNRIDWMIKMDYLEIEYKKIQDKIQRIIDYLMKEGTIF